MGRRENPIGECGESLRALAVWLRAGREAADLTYQQLAARTGLSGDTLARAASGRSVPQKLSVVLAYARGCGISSRETERLWKQARRDEARAQGALSGHRTGIDISLVKDFADLHTAVVDLYRDDGSPPLRSLDARLGGVGRLPHSTVGRVLNGRSRPTEAFVLAFAEACGVKQAALAEWGRAWRRADHDRQSARARARQERHPLRPDPLVDRLMTHSRASPRDLQVLMSDLESSARKAPDLKLLVHFPDSDSAEARRAVRMTRELLVDQAQRRGDLACPGCGCLSFGYDNAQGWKGAVCSRCGHRGTSPAPAHDEREGLEGQSDTPTMLLRPPGDDLPATTSPDTPTLALRAPLPPPLPKRVPARSWPPPVPGQQAPAIDGDSLPTVTGRAPLGQDERCAPGKKCDWLGCWICRSPARQEPSTPPDRTTLTTRIRINIPSSRPAPPSSRRSLPGPGRPRPFDWPPAPPDQQPGADSPRRPG